MPLAYTVGRNTALVFYLENEPKPGGLETLHVGHFRVGPQLNVVRLLAIDVPRQLSRRK